MNEAQIIFEEFAGAVLAPLRYERVDPNLVIVFDDECAGAGEEVVARKLHHVRIAEVARYPGDVRRNKHTRYVAAVVCAGRTGAGVSPKAEFCSFFVHCLFPFLGAGSHSASCALVSFG